MPFYDVYFPYASFLDINGEPLQNGYVYIGEPSLNPVTSPITIYWDKSTNYPISQPIRTINGYPSRNGTPYNMFVDLDSNDGYSMSVYSKEHALLFTSEFQYSDPGAGNVALKDEDETITGAWTFTQEVVINGFSSATYAQLFANETVTGTWQFNNPITVNGVNSSQYAVVSDNETVTGTWTFDNELSINGVSSADYAVVSANETVTGTWTFDNELSINGVSSADYAVVSANETISGDYDFTGALTKNSKIIYSAENGPLSGFRNKLINPYIDRWQRGTSITVTASNTYVADRHVVIFDGTANITVDQVTLGAALKIGERWVTTGLRFTLNSKSGNTFIRLVQRINSVTSFVDAPSVISSIIQGSGALTVPMRLRQNFGSGGSGDVITNFDSDLSVTASMQQLTTGVTVPSVSGATIVEASSFLAVEYDLTNLVATDFVIIPAHQFEPGPNITPFENRTEEVEVELCREYYEKSYRHSDPPQSNTSRGLSVIPFSATGATSTSGGTKEFKTRKRSVPSLATYRRDGSATNPSYWRFNIGAYYATSVVNITNDQFGISLIGLTGMAVTDGYVMDGHWVADAEIY